MITQHHEPAVDSAEGGEPRKLVEPPIPRAVHRGARHPKP